MQHIVIDPGGALPSAGLAFVVPDSREAIEAAVEALIARLDAADGDTDLEDAHDLEDDFVLANVLAFPDAYDGPGCSISDAGGDVASEDEPEGGYMQFRPSGAGCEISDPGGCPLDNGEAGDCHGEHC